MIMDITTNQMPVLASKDYMTMKNIQLILFLFLAVSAAQAQRPAPAPQQSVPVILTGGTAHLGNGSVLANAMIRFENGKITDVADAATVRLDPAGAKVIDVTGKHIYPGLIAANTNLGLSEIELVRATRDFTETGSLNPNVRAIIAYNTDSKVIPTVRSNGILLAQITPSGGTMPGQSAIVQMDAWNWEDAAVVNEAGIHLNWPRMYVSRGNWFEQIETQRENTEKEIRHIRHFFREARAYNETNHGETNLRFEAMKKLFTGEKKLFVHANFVREIIAAVNFCREYNIKMVLVGGIDALMVIDLLKENDIPVILSQTHALPGGEDHDIDARYKLPAQLKKAGIRFCISAYGFWQQRNLPFQAGSAAAYGLTPEEALMAITSDAASILGIENRVGTISMGKQATLVVSSGDILNPATNNVELAFIDGREISLRDHQKELYDIYLKKYGME
jgi:imidazolonepropionase-like amidohydrolase